MKTPLRDKHGWLRQALADHGYQQKDLAKTWGIDPALVTRFIKTGFPELTNSRLQSLARMIGMPLNELSARVTEGVGPLRRYAPPMPPVSARALPPQSADPILAELHEAVRGAQAARPEYEIRVTITLRGET